MKTHRSRGIAQAVIALAAGAALIAGGSGVALGALASTTAASAANANATSPIPIVDQNLDSAGRIRVALPTNQIGQVQISRGGAAGTAVNGPWAVVNGGQTMTMASIQGPGVFTGFTIDTVGWACGCWDPNGSVAVYVDGQQVFGVNMDWIGADWMSNEGGVMGGQWRPGWCGPCAMGYWWPPNGGIAFQNNVTVNYYIWGGHNPEYVWTNVFHNSVLPVTSSPN